MGIPVPQSGTVTEDSGVVGGFITATGNANYYLGNDNGDWSAETISGTYGSLTIDDDGVWTYSADNAQASIQALDAGETLTEVFTITSTNGTTSVTITINGADEPPCFTRGTLIDTPHGPRPVEDLRAGDEVLTSDNGPQKIKWVGSRRIGLTGAAADPRLRPVRLKAGAIAPGVPSADMLVSPMHRVLIGGAQAQDKASYILATATTGGVPIHRRIGVIRKPPPMPNRPEMNPTTAPSSTRIPAFTAFSVAAPPGTTTISVSTAFARLLRLSCQV